MATNRGRSKKWNIPLPTISDHGPASTPGTPGPLAFGQRRGSWKNPAKSSVFKRSGSNDLHAQSSHGNLYDQDESPVLDAAEINEIIAAEAFRLSRDGIIQQHLALTNVLQEQQQQQQQQQRQKMASPRVDTETARYYQECARRPKGYRRLVVSSAMTAGDDKIPPPPVKTRASFWNHRSRVASRGAGRQGGVMSPPRRSDDEEMDSFDRVEYRYIGPPNASDVLCFTSICTL